MGRAISKFMLRMLNIRNFALIDHLSLDFSSGLNILTGETGAGKSIIVDAINLILGGRALDEQVRSGENQAIIEAWFDLDSEGVIAEIIRNLGINSSEEGLLVRREINRGGRSRSFINDSLIAQATVLKTGENLVDIHGQHSHQSLLYTDRQLDLLDDFGGLRKLQEDCAVGYQRWQKLASTLEQMTSDEREKARQLDLLDFQMKEIDEARLHPGEEEELIAERTILTNAEKLYQNISQAYQILYEMENRESVIDRLAEIINCLQVVTSIDGRSKSWLEEVNSCRLTLEEISHLLRDYQEKIEFNPQRLEEIEERLDLIHRLKKKYGDSIPEILRYREQIGQQREKLVHREEELGEIRKELEKVTSELHEFATNLSRRRQNIARELEKKVEEELKSLGMEKARFSVSITRKEDPQGLVMLDGKRWELRSRGIDRIEFLLSPNPGEELKSLAKIASGGELSRIMLALKSILAGVDRIPTLIFDEVDVGIGGHIAQVVGKKLSVLGGSHQVICITHLPQIASFARTHYRVEKKPSGKRILTRVEKLESEERIKEIARMLAGEEITAVTLQHAREMWQQCQGQELKIK